MAFAFIDKVPSFFIAHNTTSLPFFLHAIENSFGPDIGETPLNSKYEGFFLLNRTDKSTSKVATKGP